jgi:hypothetical protein
MKSLFLAWQAPNRAWFPVGRLDADVAEQRYQFGYTKGALQAEHAVGFKPLPAFPEFERTYESSELFPLFQNRVLDPGRKDFAAYLTSLDLETRECRSHRNPRGIRGRTANGQSRGIPADRIARGWRFSLSVLLARLASHVSGFPGASHVFTARRIAWCRARTHE